MKRNKHLKKFLKDNLRIESAKAMVTDLKPGYREIAHELKIKLQYCIRHFLGDQTFDDSTFCKRIWIILI